MLIPIGFFGGAKASTFDLIATSIVTNSVTSTLTISSIPQTYKHLEIHVTARTNRPTTTDDPLRIILNGDSSGSSYAYHAHGTDGSSTGTGSAGYVSGGSTNYAFYSGANTSVANNFSASVIHIPNYSGGDKKTIKGHSGIQGAQSTWWNLQTSTQWFAYTGVTSVSFTPVIGPYFIAGSRISVYGIKG